MKIVRFAAEAEPGWRDADCVNVGEVPSLPVKADVHVLVEGDGLRLCCNVFVPDLQAFPFQDAVVWRDLVVIGFGSSVYCVRLSDRQSCFHALGGYFGSLLATDEFCLVASDSEILRLADDGSIVWRRGGLAADGVLISKVGEGVVEASGQWDPPDADWIEFRLDLESGERIAG